MMIRARAVSWPVQHLRPSVAALAVSLFALAMCRSFEARTPTTGEHLVLPLPPLEQPSAKDPAPARPPGVEQAALGPPAKDGEEWVLVFQDSFSGSELARSKWHTCYWWDDDGCTNRGNRELEWYQPDNVVVEGGRLRLRAKQESVRASDGLTYPYTSGMLTTGRHSYEEHLPARFTFTYGYAEIRARVPAGVGLWSAFWLLPATHKARPEIDVMEIIGHEPDMLHMHFHYRDADGEQQSVGGDWQGPDFSRGWHRFGVDWRPGAIVWYVDGVERFRFDDRDQIPAQPMYLLLNLAVGGDWPGEPDPSTRFPSTFEIDYVRVWQQEKHRKPRSAAAGGGRTARSRAAMVRPRPRGAS